MRFNRIIFPKISVKIEADKIPNRKEHTVLKTPSPFFTEHAGSLLEVFNPVESATSFLGLICFRISLFRFDKYSGVIFFLYLFRVRLSGICVKFSSCLIQSVDLR